MYNLAIVGSRSGLTMSGSPDSSTCASCSRTVRLVRLDGQVVAVDPEVIAIVPAGAHGGALASTSVVNGRRLHSGLCETYQRDARREKTRQEMAAYNKRNRKGGL